MKQTNHTTSQLKEGSPSSNLSNTQKEFIDNTIMLSEVDFIEPACHKHPIDHVRQRVDMLINAFRHEHAQGDFSLVSVVYHHPNRINRIDKMGSIISYGDVRLYILSCCDTILKQIIAQHHQPLSEINWDYQFLKRQTHAMLDHNKTLISTSSLKEQNENNLMNTTAMYHHALWNVPRRDIVSNRAQESQAHDRQSMGHSYQEIDPANETVDRFLAFMLGGLVSSPITNQMVPTQTTELSPSPADQAQIDRDISGITSDRTHASSDASPSSTVAVIQSGSIPANTMLTPAALPIFSPGNVFLHQIQAMQNSQPRRSGQPIHNIAGHFYRQSASLWQILDRIDGVMHDRFSMHIWARQLQEMTWPSRVNVRRHHANSVSSRWLAHPVAIARESIRIRATNPSRQDLHPRPCPQEIDSDDHHAEHHAINWHTC